MKEKTFDENKFIIGIDIGNSTCILSYFDFNQNKIEVMDISGGYGKISIPTLVSYNLDSKDWIFGEHVILNKGFGNDIIFQNIIQDLEKDLEYDIDGKSLNSTFIFSKYLAFLIENIKNINPNAEIVGIVAAISYYSSEKFKEKLYKAFKLANLDNVLLDIVSDRECKLKNYLKNNKVKPYEYIFSIDYGNKYLSVSLYKVFKNYELECIKIANIEDISGGNLFNISKNLITQKFIEAKKDEKISDFEKSQLDIFAYQHFDIIFQKKDLNDVKLYYNFHYPPFIKFISKSEIVEIVSFFKEEIKNFLNNFFESVSIDKTEVKHLILLGSAMEVSFINTAIEEIFLKNNAKILISKRAIADGACLIACEKLEVLSLNKLKINDLNRMNHNIGIFVKEKSDKKFEPLIYKGTFIPNEPIKKVVYLNCIKDFNLEVFMQISNTNYEKIFTVPIDLTQFLNRDIKTLRFAICLYFFSINEMIFEIEDFGFGEIFPKTDFKKKFKVTLD